MSNDFTTIRKLVDRLRGNAVAFDFAPYEDVLSAIHQREAFFETYEDRQLKTTSIDLVARARESSSLDDLLVEAFALVREVSRRLLGLRPFDVQILGALLMHQGKLAEMQTGEGKTLTAVFPAYLNALTGQGVHVLTFNDYLARRDADWMGPIYEFLELTVGFVQEGMPPVERRDAYRADITYVTAKEAGFDHLRNFLSYEAKDLVHRDFHFVIVDEADSILIDEARVPLVIAGTLDVSQIESDQVARTVRILKPDVDFELDEYERNVNLTESGVDRVESLLGCGNLHAPENLTVLTELHNALHAEVLLRRDVDYIVREGRVELVDEFTGRVAENRHWPDGLQAAVEAKEGLALQPEGVILGSTTLQQFLQLYPKVCGMTATALPSADEFEEFYGLHVVAIPPNRPCVRVDYPDVVFTHQEAKHHALVREIQQVHATGRPVLVGTSSVKESEYLAELLQKTDIVCQVLNAKNDEQEARVIAEAGSLGAVTISTNMAGRGTDIRLGGAQEEHREAVVALGGLYVIGTNRHESRRVDNQLRGRAGRQGDPGASRFWISLEDDLIKRYGVDGLIPPKFRPKEQDDPMDQSVIHQEIARAQRIIEGQNLEIRKTLRKYVLLVEEQRLLVQGWRQEVLLGGASLLEARAQERYSELCDRFGRDALEGVERQISLFHIDQYWADHLGQIADVRDGIHLASVGGQNPLDEFHKRIVEAFQTFPVEVEERILHTFNQIEMTQEGIDLDKEGLRGPSSTWTYLITDEPFAHQLETMLASSMGVSAAAAIGAGPLLFWWGLYRHWKMWRARKK